MDASTLTIIRDLISTLGFPITAAVFLFIFLTQITKWILARNDKQYEDHRTDIINLTEIHNKSLNNVTNTFNEQSAKRDERDRAILASQEEMSNKLGEMSDNLIEIGKGQLRIVEYIDSKTNTK